MQSAYLYMGFSILMWSVFPLFLKLGVNEVDPLLFLFLMQVSAGVSALVIGLFLLKNKPSFSKALVSSGILKNPNFIGYTAICGACSLCYGLCFSYAMLLSSEMGATIILEAWPIHAVYMSYIFIKKDWQKIEREDYLIGSITIVGFIIIVSSSIPSPMSMDIEFEAIFGFFLALIGALTLALSTVLRARISQDFAPVLQYEKNEEKKAIVSVLFGETFARLATLPFFALAFLITEVDMEISTYQLSVATLMGILIYNLGTAAYSLALLKANSPTIHLSWFFMCILSIVWLQVAGEDKITLPVIMGMICILLANGFLTYKNIRKQRLVKETAPHL